MDALVNLKMTPTLIPLVIFEKIQKLTKSQPGDPSDVKKIQHASGSVPRHFEMGGFYPTVLATLCDLSPL
jgi:hypothetical protein